MQNMLALLAVTALHVRGCQIIGIYESRNSKSQYGLNSNDDHNDML